MANAVCNDKTVPGAKSKNTPVALHDTNSCSDADTGPDDGPTVKEPQNDTISDVKRNGTFEVEPPRLHPAIDKMINE